jgi:hypothetical protein
VIENHEFRIEPWGGLDREARFDEERVYARRLARRQVLGLAGALALKLALGYFVYATLGWIGVAFFSSCVLVVVFIRGTHAYPR